MKAQNLQVQFEPETVGTLNRHQTIIFPSLHISRMLLSFLPGNYEKNIRDWSENSVQTKYRSSKVIY